MQVIEKENNGLKRRFEVTVDAEALNVNMENRLKALGSQVNLPGFRPGHVPMAVLKQRYGASVMAEVLEQTVRQTCQQALRERELRPALQPKVEIKDFNENGPLTYEIEVDLLPDVTLPDFAAVKLEKIVCDVSDAEINDGVESLAKRNKRFTAVAAPAELGNAVVMDFEGKVDGVPFDGGKAEGFRLELGSGHFIPGFEEQLVGAKTGDERVVKVTFPEQYHSADLAGKPAEFSVKIHTVEKGETPTLDDALAKEIGFESLDALKKAIREQMANDYASMTRARMKKQLFDHLEKIIDFPIPESMVTLEFDAIWQRLKEAQAEGSDASLNRPDDELRADYQRIAQRRVRLGILLAEVGRAQKLQVTQEELSRAVMQQARYFPGQEKKVFEHYRAHPEQLEDLRGPILEEKAVDFILEKISFTEKKVSREELMKELEISGESLAA